MSASPPVPPTPDTRPSDQKAIYAALLHLSPEKVSKALGNSLVLRGLFLLVLWAVVVPFAMMLLVSFWLKSLNAWASSEGIGRGLAGAIRDEIVEFVHEGFAMSAPLEKSHQHLDYYERISVTFPADKASPHFTRINIEPRQQMQINFRKVEMYAAEPTCSITGDDQLIEVKLGHAPVTSLPKVDNMKEEVITAKWWDEYAARLTGDKTSQPLMIKATDKVAQMRCARISVDADVLVYKRFYKPPPKGTP